MELFHLQLFRDIWEVPALLLAGVFPGLRNEQAASPASYPTTSTRWLMNPAANARTDFYKPMSTVARSNELWDII